MAPILPFGPSLPTGISSAAARQSSVSHTTFTSPRYFSFPFVSLLYPANDITRILAIDMTLSGLLLSGAQMIMAKLFTEIECSLSRMAINPQSSGVTSRTPSTAQTISLASAASIRTTSVSFLASFTTACTTTATPSSRAPAPPTLSLTTAPTTSTTGLTTTSCPLTPSLVSRSLLFQPS